MKKKDKNAPEKCVCVCVSVCVECECECVCVCVCVCVCECVWERERERERVWAQISAVEAHNASQLNTAAVCAALMQFRTSSAIDTQLSAHDIFYSSSYKARKRVFVRQLWCGLLSFHWDPARKCNIWHILYCDIPIYATYKVIDIIFTYIHSVDRWRL